MIKVMVGPGIKKGWGPPGGRGGGGERKKRLDFHKPGEGREKKQKHQ